MAQEHQEENSIYPETHSVRRKRGRPRKDDISGAEPYKQTQRCKVDVGARGNDPFVGQVVSGVLDGKFDAGYMLTVCVGERGSLLRGVVFEPGLSVPISAANDIAPNVKMFERAEVPLPGFAWQLPGYTPLRSRKGAAVVHYQRNESSVSSKGICADAAAKDINGEAQAHALVDIKGLPENGSHHASGNLKQDLQSTSGDNGFKDGNQSVQTTNTSAEWFRTTHLPEEVGYPSTAPDSSKIVHIQQVFSDGKPNTSLSQTISKSKQSAMSDDISSFTSDNKTANVEEVNNIKLVTQMSQTTSEPKQTSENLDVGPIFTRDNKTLSLHEIFSDAKLFTEFSQDKTSECKQSAEASNTGLVFTNRTSDDYDKPPPPVTVQSSEHATKGVADLGEALQAAESSVEESGVQHSVKLTLEDGTVAVAEGNDSTVGQESRVHLEPLGSESNKPVESSCELLKDNALGPKVFPEQPHSDLAAPCGNSIKVSSGAISNATNRGSGATDVNNGS